MKETEEDATVIPQSEQKNHTIIISTWRSYAACLYWHTWTNERLDGFWWLFFCRWSSSSSFVCERKYFLMRLLSIYFIHHSRPMINGYMSVLRMIKSIKFWISKNAFFVHSLFLLETSLRINFTFAHLLCTFHVTYSLCDLGIIKTAKCMR